MSAKIIILFVLSILVGIALICTGIYFLSKKYISKLNAASPDQEPSTIKKNQLRAKTSAYISFGIGALTLIWSAFIITFPQMAVFLSLFYMIFLMIASIVLIFTFK